MCTPTGPSGASFANEGGGGQDQLAMLETLQWKDGIEDESMLLPALRALLLKALAAQESPGPAVASGPDSDSDADDPVQQRNAER